MRDSHRAPTDPTTTPAERIVDAPPAALPPCPDDAALRGALIRDAYPRVDRIFHCKAGAFPHPGFAVVASNEIRPYGSSHDAPLAIVSERTRDVIASIATDCPVFERDRYGAGMRCTVDTLELADLDGDGLDELLVEESHRDFNAHWLSIYSVQGSALKKRLGYALAPRPSRAGGCYYRYAVGLPDVRNRRPVVLEPIGGCVTCTVFLDDPKSMEPCE